MLSWVREAYFKTIDMDLMTRMGLSEIKVLDENKKTNTVIVRADNARTRKPSDRRAVKKFLLPNGDSQAQATSWAYFKHEVTFLQSLKHPNIVKMTAAVSCPRYLGIVMECATTDLHERLLHLAPERSSHIVSQLVDAVCFLHGKRVIHGDLKVDNVIYSPRTGIVKLCDFGHAQTIPEYTIQPQVWQSTKEHQPPEYNTPELWHAFKMESYSLGILCFAVLMKRYPDTSIDYLAKIDKYADDFEAQHIVFLKHLLTKSPVHRPTVAQISHILVKPASTAQQ